MDESEEALLGSDNEAADQEESPAEGRVIIPKRTVIIEPLLIAFIFFALPSSSASAQYILNAFLSDLGANSTSNQTTCAANQTEFDPGKELEAEAQSQAAYFSLYLDLLQGIPAAIIGIFLGNYSDKAGRKYAIVPPCIGLSIKCLFYVVVISLEANIYYLFIGAFLDGCCGSFTTLLCGSLAYVTDIISVEKRTFRITVVEMCMLLPSVLSAVGTGYLIKATGYLPPFIIMLIGVVLTTAYAIFFIPETINKDQSAKFFSTDHLKEAFFIYFKDNGTSRSVCLILLLCSLIGPLLVSFSTGIDTLFQMNSPLCWSSVTIGIYSSTVLATVAGGGLISAYFLRKCLSDAGMILLSGISSALNSAYKSVVRTTPMMFISLGFYPLGFLYIPTIRSLMSKHVEPTEYGGMFAGIAAVEALCTVVGHVVFNPIYAQTNSYWPGAVYLVMGASTLSGILFFLAYKCVKWRQDRKSTKEQSACVSQEDEKMITG